MQEIINTQAQFGEGYVAVGLYPLSNVDIAYESLKNLTHFGGEVSSSAYQNPGIGEKLTVFLSVSGFYSTEVVFTRCHTVVYIMLKYQKPPNLTSVLSYAAKLDARLAEVACLK